MFAARSMSPLGGGAGDEGGGDSSSGPAHLLLGRVLARRSCAGGVAGTGRLPRACPTRCLPTLIARWQQGRMARLLPRVVGSAAITVWNQGSALRLHRQSPTESTL